MDKKFLFAFAAALTVSSASFAGPRTMEEARKLAADFASGVTSFQGVTVSDIVSFEHDAMVARSPQLYPAYYVFNVADNAGFIIVSGDDAARPILAFGDEGSFVEGQIPENVQAWLDFYQREISSIDQKEDVYVYDNGGVADPGKTVVKPLMGRVSWGQDYPFHLKTPAYQGAQTATGCAATSMAMVMKHHEYPESGEGRFSYSTERFKLPVQVELGQKYNWSLMKDKYSKNDTDESKNEVAILMAHVGASLEMDYGPASSGGSGASVYAHLPALVKNFHYNENMYFMHRDYTNAGNWEYLIKKELDEKRPILYSGQSKNGGHSFICDGYTESNYYHFNWGWEGNCDGYYALTSLSPGVGGTGAGDGNFSEYQVILLGVQPEKTGTPRSGFCMDGAFTPTKETYGRNEELVFNTSECYNLTSIIKNGKVGLGLFNGTSFVGWIGTPQDLPDFQIGYGYGNLKVRGTLPSGVASGTYQIALCSQTEGEDTPSKAMAREGKFAFMNAEITNESIILTKPSAASALKFGTVQLVGAASLKGNVQFNIEVQNEGSDFFGELGVYIKYAKGLTPSKARLVKNMSIPSGEKKTIELKDVLPSEINRVGEYKVFACYKDNGEWKDSEHYITINILEEGSSIENLSAENKMAVSFNEGIVRVENAVAGEMVELYTTNGTLLERVLVDASGVAEFVVAESGVYLVCQNGQAVKVVC